VPRINIEDAIWKDNRFQDLLILVKNRHTAKGMILELFTVAQKYWLTSKGRGIPKPAWASEGLPDELIKAGLARDDGEFIYAIGSREQFAWLDSASEKGRSGGPAAAKARRENIGKSKRPKSSQHDTARPSTSSSSSSSSFSLSSSDSNSDSVSNPFTLESSDSASVPKIAPTTPVWESYSSAMLKRHGEMPARDRETNALLSKLVQRLGTEAPAVAAFYVSHNDKLYVGGRHPLSLLVRDYQRIRIEWKTGSKMTSQQARAAEVSDHAQDQIRRIKEGLL
jgi:hypothetical protein